MKTGFFDVNVYAGMPKKILYKLAKSAKELLGELDRQGMEKAVVWHIAQYELSPIDGNPMLAEFIKGQKRLYGCWAILPPQTGEVITGDFFSLSCQWKKAPHGRAYTPLWKIFPN